MLKSRELDSADYRRRQAHDVDENDGLMAWSSGKKTLENSPNDPFITSSAAPEPRQISSSQPLSETDKAAIQAGEAVIAFRHDEVLDDQAKALIEGGQAVQLPRLIPANTTDTLTAQDLQDLSSGKATIASATRPGDPQYSRNRYGQTEVPANDLQRGLDSGAVSLEDLASGKAKLIS
jgi:hypothetical protein